MLVARTGAERVGAGRAVAVDSGGGVGVRRASALVRRGVGGRGVAVAMVATAVAVGGRGVVVGGAAIAVWKAGGGAEVAVGPTGVAVAVAVAGAGGDVAVASGAVEATVAPAVGDFAIAVWNAGGGSEPLPDDGASDTDAAAGDSSGALVAEITAVALISGIRSTRGVAVGPAVAFGWLFPVSRSKVRGVAVRSTADGGVVVATVKLIAVGAATLVPRRVSRPGELSASAGSTRKPSTAPTAAMIAAAQRTGIRNPGRRRRPIVGCWS